jgi:hypothetical protein
MALYKFLTKQGAGTHRGAKWHLPENDKPGKWMPELRGKLIVCERGYHLCRESDLLEWIGPTLYEAEYEGELIEADNKVVTRKARLVCKVETWNERTMRLFACDCAERALEKTSNPDPRSVEAIRVARAYANGQATAEQLAAARAAARDAARAAARDAARAAERKWQTERLMQYIRGKATPNE